MVQLVVIAGVSMAVAWLATRASLSWSIGLAKTLGSSDNPADLKNRAGRTPRLGGVAIALGALAGVASTAWLLWGLGDFALREILAVGFGAAVVFVVGFYDDLYGLSPSIKLASQVVAALILVSVGIRFGLLSIPFFGEFHLGVIATLASVLWILGVTNAVNFIDGLDGLAAGVVAIIASSFAIYAIANGQSLSLIVSASAVGASVAFLNKNWTVARDFMGDSGSLTLGFLLAAVSVHSSLKTSTAVAILVPILVALAVPVVQALVVVARRLTHPPAAPGIKARQHKV